VALLFVVGAIVSAVFICFGLCAFFAFEEVLVFVINLHMDIE